MTDAPQSDLLPCPFCGDGAWFSGYAAQCNSCGAQVLKQEKGAAISAWNHRTGVVVTDDAELGRAMRTASQLPWAAALVSEIERLRSLKGERDAVLEEALKAVRDAVEPMLTDRNAYVLSGPAGIVSAAVNAIRSLK